MKKFFIALFSLLIYIACQYPYSPQKPEQPPIPQGMGSFTLRIAGVEARTILPNTENPSNALQSYKLVFSLNGTGPAIERTITNLSTSVFLEAGTYTLRVIGYTDTAWQKPAAEGRPSSNSIVIQQGGVTSCAVTLTAYGVVTAAEGTFSWNITLPNALQTASMTVTPLLENGTGTPSNNLLSGVSVNQTGSHSFASGYYQMTIVLAKTNFQNIIWYETLHIYQNMTSRFEHGFTNNDFTQNKYTITFIYNDGVTPQGKQTRAYEQKATAPAPAPTRTGYTFDGWYMAEIGGTPWDFNMEITGDVTLYARWTEIPKFTVTFDANNATSGTPPAPQTVTAGSSIILPSQGTFSRSGFTSRGWNTNADGTGTNYSAVTSYTPTGDITLYAWWTYYVGFNINDGSGTAPSTQYVNPGSSINLPSGSGLTRSGYTFEGWNANPAGTGINYNAGALITVINNVFFYARWVELPKFTVTFDTIRLSSSSGTPPAAQTVTAGSSIILPDQGTLNRLGHTFVCWDANSNGIFWPGTNYSAGASYAPTGDITLYAVWGWTLTAGTWDNFSLAGSSFDYAFNVTSGMTYYVWWNDRHQGNNTKALDIKVSAYYSDGTSIFINQDSGWSSPQQFNARSNDTVIIIVQPYNIMEMGTYAITYSTSNTRPQ